MKSLKINNVVKVFFMALVLSLTTISCSTDSLSEDEIFYEQGSEGDDGKVKDEPEG